MYYDLRYCRAVKTRWPGGKKTAFLRDSPFNEWFSKHRVLSSSVNVILPALVRLQQGENTRDGNAADGPTDGAGGGPGAAKRSAAADDDDDDAVVVCD